MTADAELLARWRTLGARHSEEVLELGPRVLRSGGLGDQGEPSISTRTMYHWAVLMRAPVRAEWAVREQLAIAALDTGRIALATVSKPPPPPLQPWEPVPGPQLTFDDL